MLRLVNSVPGNVHHTVGKRGTDKDADRGNHHYDFKRCSFRAYCRIHEIDRIVTNSD